jgi:hypothetical protein
MRIISFDVGMKNLAYCLFTIPNSLDITSQEATAANIIHHIKIERWDVIDLRFEPLHPETTGVTTAEVAASTPKRTCMNDTKLAKWMYLPTPTSTQEQQEHTFSAQSVSFYCSKCGEKSKYKTPCREILQYKRKPELLAKKKLDELMDIKANLSASAHVPAAQNIKLRKADLIQKIKNTLSRDYMEPFDETKYSNYITNPMNTQSNVKPKKPNYTYAHDLDLITYGRNLTKHLDHLLYGTATFSNIPIDMMIIENQISTLASRMKTLQGMITQYFIMKEVPQIEFISASCKLKLFTDTPLSHHNSSSNEDELIIDASTYTDRKKSGIAVCRSLGEISRKRNSDYAKWMPVFETHKKKDDLADCFLQGLWRVHLLCAV